MWWFWLVDGGDVSPASPDTDWDGQESVLVFAPSAEEALEAARRYDAGELGIDTVFVGGVGPVACLMAPVP